MTSNYKSCNFGSVTIYKGGLFCGSHAKFLTYPVGNVLNISLKFHECVSVDLLFRYSVINHNIITNDYYSYTLTSLTFPDQHSKLVIKLIKLIGISKF